METLLLGLCLYVLIGIVIAIIDYLCLPSFLRHPWRLVWLEEFSVIILWPFYLVALAIGFVLAIYHTPHTDR